MPLLLFCGESPSVLGSSPLLVLPLLCVGIMGSSPLLCLLIAVAWRCSWLGRAGLSCKIHSSCRQCLSLLLQCCTRMFSLCWALGSCLEPNVVERLVNCAQVCWSTVHLLVYQHECMYVSIYVCMYVCMYVSMCVCVCIYNNNLYMNLSPHVCCKFPYVSTIRQVYFRDYIMSASFNTIFVRPS